MKRQTIFSLLLILFSCSSINKKEYLNWVEDPSNNLYQVFEDSIQYFEIQLQPERYRILKSNYSSKLNNNWSNTLNFLIDVTPKKSFSNTFSTYSSIKNYYSYSFGKSINICQNNNIINNDFFHLESGYLKYNTFRVNVFFDTEKLDCSKPFELVIGDSVLHFTISEEQKIKLII
ncbi:hypothetical protein MY04_5283 [Flammeovirga sp. MY04]|uniref:hypothetical protein n=1 Tax=Flammeovirga sp. MY04 TaxID=1191459 RepID=UPI0008064185|nr:hypothetical protein [Flammeovirga sp. MY04]ANQ52615.1 hypothetical protein MY04_5283 [Flammeovirga sp. MY04]